MLSEKEKLCLKALECLYLEVDSKIADDVKQKVIEALQEKENTNSIYPLLGGVPSLQDYLKWALEPESGFRSHEEIYNFFARYFA